MIQKLVCTRHNHKLFADISLMPIIVKQSGKAYSVIFWKWNHCNPQVQRKSLEIIGATFGWKKERDRAVQGLEWSVIRTRGKNLCGWYCALDQLHDWDKFRQVFRYYNTLPWSQGLQEKQNVFQDVTKFIALRLQIFSPYWKCCKLQIVV